MSTLQVRLVSFFPGGSGVGMAAIIVLVLTFAIVGLGALLCRRRFYVVSGKRRASNTKERRANPKETEKVHGEKEGGDDSPGSSKRLHSPRVIGCTTALQLLTLMLTRTRPSPSLTSPRTAFRSTPHQAPPSHHLTQAPPQPPAQPPYLTSLAAPAALSVTTGLPESARKGRSEFKEVMRASRHVDASKDFLSTRLVCRLTYSQPWI